MQCYGFIKRFVGRELFALRSPFFPTNVDARITSLGEVV